jgi:hypothetical protein
MSEYKAPEALSWLTKNKNQHALAGNRFPTTADAIEAVERLYSAGATRVCIGPPFEEPERIREDGGPYADMLDIVFPKERLKDVTSVVRTLAPDEGGKLKDVLRVEGRYRRIMLWWD